MKKSLFLLVLAATVLTACDSILDIDDPTTTVSSNQVYSSTEGIRTAVTGLYTANFLNYMMIYQNLDYYYSYFSDDLKAANSNFSEYYQSNYSPSSSFILNIWQNSYRAIFHSNDFITRIDGTTLIPEAERNQYVGEALWFRAFYYLTLINTFGDVPLVLTTDVGTNATLPRTPIADINAQIIKDLEQSIELQANSTNPKTRITRDASIALLARAYLYQEQWQKALETANLLIPSSDGGLGGNKYELETPEKVFISNSKEQILQNNMEGYSGTGTYRGYTLVGSYLFIPSTATVNYFLSDELIAEFQKVPDDQRWKWIGSSVNSGQTYYYPYKYKNKTTPSSANDYEYHSVLRLAEQYLIRSEANAQLNNIPNAVSDINIIRRRAGLEPLSASISQADLLRAIETERRKEFFAEQGHRWFDIRRTGRIDAVMEATSYKLWNSYKSLLPIPQQEINRNKNLTQNTGY
ncbi:MAG: RagB/SusD family nutrient uptake outer membrane protein [Prevotella sp.]|nr:RagB/SusD family nutrient uptake outer membrane protein [Prevotella sp.]